MILSEFKKQEQLLRKQYNIPKVFYFGYDDEVSISPEQAIYALFCGKDCAYVGQSHNIIRRIKTHKRHLLFDTCIIIPFGNTYDLNYCEQLYINLFNPTLNGSFTSYEKQHYGGAMNYNIVKKICDNLWDETYGAKYSGRYVT